MKIKLFTIPNIITLCNLLCGSMATLSAFVYGDIKSAFYLILAAAVCDFLDGASARLLKQYSAIGVQLDSLADMVSFGLTPAAILYTLISSGATYWHPFDGFIHFIAGIPFLVTAFSALRLAKFNIDDTQHTEFCGLPTPAAAIFCASFAVLLSDKGIEVPGEWLALLSVIVASLLISPIRMFSLKFSSFKWQENKVRFSFVATALCAIIVWGIYSVAFIIVTYIAVSTLLWICHRKK